MFEQWVLLYSASQDAYHVEMLAEYRQKGEGAGGYKIVGVFPTQDAALQFGSRMRQQAQAR